MLEDGDKPHHSWKEFYDQPPESLPFNSAPDKTVGAGEMHTFFSIPLKQNTRKIPNSALLPLQSAIKHLISPESKFEYPRSSEMTRNKPSYLDFEAALYPHLVNDGSKWNLEDYYFQNGQNGQKLV